MTFKQLDNIIDELKCVKAQNAVMEGYLRSGKMIDLYEMIRSQNQYLDYLIERLCNPIKR